MRYLLMSLFFMFNPTFPRLNAGILFNKGQQAVALLSHAHQLADQQRYDSSLLVYDLALAIADQNRDWKTMVNVMSSKGYVLTRVRKYDLAKAALDSAQAIALQNHLDGSIIADLYYSYGFFYSRINRAENSLKEHNKALATRLEILGPHHVKVAESYNGIGEVYRYSLHEYLKAEQNFQAAISILKRLPQPDPLELYRGYYNLATTNRLLRDFDKALAYAFKSVEVLKSTGEPINENLAKCYGVIANIYDDKRLSGRAVEYYQKSIKSRRDIDTKPNHLLALDYYNLGLASVKLGESNRALESADSIILMVKDYFPSDSLMLANGYVLKAAALRYSDRYEEAIRSYRLAVNIQEVHPKISRVLLARTLRQFSTFMFELKRYEEALFYAQKSINAVIPGSNELKEYENPSYETLEKKPYLYQMLAIKGRASREIGLAKGREDQLEMALECLLLAESLMNLHWQSQDMEMDKLRFIEKNYLIYEIAIDCCYLLYKKTREKGYVEKAYWLMEQSKSRLLSERIQEVEHYLTQDIPDSIMKVERKLKTEMAILQGRKDMLGKRALPDSLERAIGLQVLRLEEELSDWQSNLARLFPQAKLKSFKNSILPIESIVSFQKNVVFIEYFSGTRSIYAITAGEGIQELVKIEADSLYEQAEQFIQLVAKGPDPDQLVKDFKDYTRLAFKLYNRVLFPALSNVKSAAKEEPLQLRIVPDGVLNLLPFHALIDSQPGNSSHVNYKDLDYLVHNYIFSYGHSATAHFKARNPVAQPKVLAFGWPEDSENRGNILQLAGAKKEIDNLSKIVPGKFLAGKNASKTTFISEAPKYGVLHLAIHGGVDPNKMYSNFLQFADGNLYAYELFNLNLENDLTVLGACETGYGKVFTSEGVYSMSRAFSCAGSKSQLVTLWKIGDQSTAFIIEQFYEGVNLKKSLNSAINNSQLSYIESTDQYGAHPAYWAGIALWGVSTPIELGQRYRMTSLIYCSLLIVVAAFLMFFLLKKHLHLHPKNDLQAPKL